MTRLPIVVLISGGGSNLQAIIDAVADEGLPADILAVISNNPAAYGLERARRAGIPALTVDHRAYPDRGSFETALEAAIDAHQPALIVLAGFMRILGTGFVTHYLGRMLNIHPSLLPAFTGLDTHRRAIESGEKEHGASVHFVTSELDGGPVIIQSRVPILPDDDVKRLAAKVLEREHRIYPLAIRWFAEGRLTLENDRIMLDGQPLTAPVDYANVEDTTQHVGD